LQVTDTDWVGTVWPALSALAAWVALVFSIYNAYARRKDRTPRVELAASWNLPRDVPEAAKGPGVPTTSNPGEANFHCEITNIGIAGVKIREVYVYVDAPPGKPIPLHLPQEGQPRKLDNGDSQTWSAGPFVYDRRGGVATWIKVLALDTVGNRHEIKNPAFSGYSSGSIRRAS
jgi:hypothetical protein